MPSPLHSRLPLSLRLPLLLPLALLLSALLFRGASALAATAGVTTLGSTSYPGGPFPSYVGTLTLNNDETGVLCMVIDPQGRYAYAATYTAPSVVVKIRLSDFTRVASLTLNGASGEYYIKSAAIDPAGHYAYFLGGSQPGCVVKVRLADFTCVGVLTDFSTNESFFSSAWIDPVGAYLYVASGFIDGTVIKVRLSDFTRVGTLTFNHDETYLGPVVADPAAGFLYYGSYDGSVVKVRLSNFTRVGALVLNGGGGIRCAAIDPAAGFAYFGIGFSSQFSPSTRPGNIIKVRLSDFTQVATLTLDAGELVPMSAVVDPATGFAYFGVSGDSSTIGSVVKIRLSDFTRVSGLALIPPGAGFYCAAFDSVGGNLYFGTYSYPATAPGTVVKLGLSFYKNSLRANQITLGGYGQVNDVRFYSHAARGNLRLAIYTDDAVTTQPWQTGKTLLWQSESMPNPAAGAWVTVPISAGTPQTLKLPPGQYWLAWQSDTIDGVPSYSNYYWGSGGFSVNQPYGAFPARLGPANFTWNRERWSQYLTYDPSRNAVAQWRMYP